jgi:mycothione reductase
MPDYDLVIVGAGSGNMLPETGLEDLRVAIIESDRFGGTCMNRGCLPSKMYVYTADVAQTVRHAGRFGIDATFAGADWPAIRDRVFGRIDPLVEGAPAYRRSTGVDVWFGHARFTGPGVLDVDGEQIRADRIVLAVGSRPHVPAIPGLDRVAFHTSDTIMRVDALPASMVVVGGGFVAAELSHVFGALGTKITIVNRGPALLERHDRAIARAFTDRYRARFDVRLDTRVARVDAGGAGVEVHVDGPDGPEVVDAELLLLATGRVPNGDLLDVGAAGIVLDDDGHVHTDDTYATNVPGVWAIGDLANHYQLKHLANAEIRLVIHNLLHGDDPRRARFPFVPAAVFADPQVASAGPTEEELRARGVDYVVARRDYAETGYGWALEDTTSFAKVMADPHTRRLLAAHVIGPHAAMLIQPLVQAMNLGNTVEQLTQDVLYIHPALTELVAQVLLELPGSPP